MNIGEPMRDSEGYLTPEQFEHLISFTDNNRDKTLFTFLFYTGRRVSEVVRMLTPKDFNFRDNMVYFTILKRKSKVSLWINVKSIIMDMMKNYIDSIGIGENDFIFPINRFRVDQIIKSLGEKAGMLYVGKKKIHAHVLRHSFAIMMSKKLEKADINDAIKLQSVMAHSNINSTLYYLRHFNPREMKEFVE